uniref:Anti-CBASS protein Acb1-like N-terminal domain-containing protein n=1 Tax=viral metagenome TaxID=1070528 RepID=A0A6M3IVV2_9ZZZZ
MGNDEASISVPDTSAVINVQRAILNEVSLLRRETLAKLFDPNRDINDACGYPTEISIEQYKEFYKREWLAKRVVQIFPEACWTEDPVIFENEDPDETEFEKAVSNLNKDLNLFHFLHRIDELSGIGRYGILLLGLKDGQNSLTLPVTKKEGVQLIYLRAYDESVLAVDSVNTDVTSPRYGFPEIYKVNTADASGSTGILDAIRVHWSRVLHVADNRTTSEIYGAPRQEIAYNRIWDCRKILSGSGEMFWLGAFPGYSFEINPDMQDATIDTASIREELSNYQNGLQRYLAISGVSAKSLAPQVADPTGHLAAQIKATAIAMGVPMRILMGSEEAKLASQSDKETFNSRVKCRQDKYVSPMIIRPFIDRMIEFGVLPEVADYTIQWPDLNSPSEEDKANVAKAKSEALAKFVQGDVAQLIPEAEFLKIVMGMSQEEVDSISAAVEERQKIEVDLEREMDRMTQSEDSGDNKGDEENAVEQKGPNDE